MRVELPVVIFNPHSPKLILQRKQGRIFSIADSRSIQSITREIHERRDIDQYGLVRFNLPNAQGRYNHSILTLESDDDTVPLAVHRNIALFVAKRLHRKYHCQVQVVWSGNKSFHVHFRIHRRDLSKAEAVAIQKLLTNRMQRRVRNKFNLPNFAFDQRVAGNLGLVRLGGGTRIQIDRQPVQVNQEIVLYLDSNFGDTATTFPLDDGLKRTLQSAAVRKARSRSKQKEPGVPLPSDKLLLRYREFLEKAGSTVRPSHWAFKNGRQPVIVCYWGPKDRNPSCILARNSYFVTDTRDKKHPVVFSFRDFMQARKNDLRSRPHGNDQ